jgi:uncharacterized delta-60 repeat protein
MHRFGLAGLVVVVLIALAAPVAALAADGDLDPTFAGGAGFRADQMALSGTFGSFADGMTLAPDGAPLVTSFATGTVGEEQFTIAKFLPDGSAFDTSFNTTGVRQDQRGFGAAPFSDAGEHFVVAPDGTIVVPGGASDDTPPLADEADIQRYTATGGLDAAFGGGSVRSNLTGGVGTHTSSFSDAVALGDGSVIAAGSDLQTSAPHRLETLVAKYTPAGIIDTSFAPPSPGVLHQQLATAGTDDSSWSRIVQQPDGKLVLVGETSGTTNGNVTIVQRLNANGTVDTTFGTGGLVRIQISPLTADHAITSDDGLALAPDGSIFVGATVSYITDPPIPPDPDPEDRFEVGLTKLQPNGTLDPTFGTGGSVLHQFGVPAGVAHADSSLRDLALAPDGKIVVGGEAGDVAAKSETLIARFLPNGTLDPTFGSGGAFVHQFADPAAADGSQAIAVAVASSGAILLAGSTEDTTGKSRTLLARLVGNTAPTAAIAPVAGAQEGISQTLDASGSTDADGAITGYSWDLNGDGAFGDATGVKPSATFTKGSHKISVQVTDNYGLTATASQTFTVAALPGIVKAPGSGSVSGTSASVVLTCSAGPDCTGAVLLQSLTGTHATIAKAKHKSHKATSYGRGTFSIKAGGHKTIKIHLTAAARKALRHHSSLKAYMLVTTKAGSTSKTTHRTITLHVHRATHKPKHSRTKH